MKRSNKNTSTKKTKNSMPSTKMYPKKRNKGLPRKSRFAPALIVALLFGGIGSYIISQSYAAVGDTYTSNVMVNIPGNGPACTWLCFNPDVDQVSIYIVPTACASQSANIHDWCSDITSADITSCHTYDVQSDSQSISTGTMTFRAYGPNAGQGVGQYHYDLYAAAGSSCGTTYSHSSASVPNSTVYIGPHPSCDTALGEECPEDEDDGGSDDNGGQGNNQGNNGSGTDGTGSGSGTNGNGNGKTGNGTGGENGEGSGPNPATGSGGSSGGSIAKQQSSDPNKIPSTSKQGKNNNQSDVIPSPFYDGKQYEPGSLEDTFGVVSIGDKAISKFWLYVFIALVLLISASAGGYWWWRKHKKTKA